MKNYLLILVVALLFPFAASAQLTTDNSMTVEQYVTQVLLGANVTVSNITFNGVPASQVSAQVGSFQSNGSNMSIGSGLIMTSGNVAGAQGPNNTSSSGTDTGEFNSFGDDPDLMALVTSQGGTSINDWAIIEFDFVPLGDTLRFNYVFASEEYDYYANTTYTDVFGFFISGPGISGTYSNGAMNIALIPGTDIGVGINTINNGGWQDTPGMNQGPCEYCEFYNQDYPNDNYLGSNPNDPLFTDSTYMQYDGYTDILTAFAIVQCGQTYHIKLAITDSGDSGFDSAVFIQEDSFSSNLVVQVDLQFDVAGPDGMTTFEDCGTNYVTFSRPQSSDVNNALTALISYEGTAQYGVDYTGMPTEVNFEPGVTSVVFPLEVVSDFITEGIETVHMVIENIAECSGVPVQSSFDFNINDTAEPLAIIDEDFHACPGQPLTIEPNITGGYGNYHYQWSTGANTETITESPTNDITYFLTVSDTCGLAPASNAYQVYTFFPALVTTLTPNTDVLLECGDFVQLVGSVTGGNDASYNVSWTDDSGNMLWPDWDNEYSMTYYSWNGGGPVNFTVTDACGNSSTQTVNITLNAPQLFVVVPPSITTGCGAPISFTADVSGGVPGYYYTWYFNGVYDWSNYTETYTGTASSAGTISVDVSDGCGQTVTAYTEIIIDSPPIVIDMTPELYGDCTTAFNYTPTVTGGIPSYTYSWFNNGVYYSGNAALQATVPTTTLFQLQVIDACGTSASSTISLVIDNPAIVLDLGEDIQASCIDSTHIFPAILEAGAGAFSFNWSYADSTDILIDTLVIQRFVTTTVHLQVTDACGSTATDSLQYIIPDVPLTITASADTILCVGNDVSLWALAEGGEGGFSYAWSPGFGSGATLNLSNLLSGGYYRVVAEDICGKQISDTVLVIVNDVQPTLQGEEVSPDFYSFAAVADGQCIGCNYFWDFADGTTAYGDSVDHQFDGAAEYLVTLTVVDSIGCTGSDVYMVYPTPSLYIPTSFSPNNDGLNDVFQAIGVGVRTFELSIFNRWGDRVYHSTSLDDYWMGNDGVSGTYFVNDGAYVFVAKAIGYRNEVVERSGTITLVR